MIYPQYPNLIRPIGGEALYAQTVFLPPIRPGNSLAYKPNIGSSPTMRQAHHEARKAMLQALNDQNGIPDPTP